jgi:hypothetical protein
MIATNSGHYGIPTAWPRLPCGRRALRCYHEGKRPCQLDAPLMRAPPLRPPLPFGGGNRTSDRFRKERPILKGLMDLLRDLGRFRGWMIGLAAAVRLGAVLRLVWVTDMEYKGDEAWTFDRTQHVGQTEPFAWVGMRSSLRFHSPGMKPWRFLLLRTLFAAKDPPWRAPSSRCRSAPPAALRSCLRPVVSVSSGGQAGGRRPRPDGPPRVVGRPPGRPFVAVRGGAASRKRGPSRRSRVPCAPVRTFAGEVVRSFCP